MAIQVLGTVTVDHDGALAPRDRVVLAALVAAHGEIVGAETLADALWADEPPASWLKIVQGCVVRLRKVLGAAAIETRAAGYRLAVARDEIDAGRFELLLARARELLTLGEPERAMYMADEAMACWRGRAFPELDEWDRGRTEAARLEELRLDAQELRVEAALQAGRYREVLADARALVADAPVREHRWMLLATAQYQAGRQGEALRALRAARSVLRRELGLDPGADLVELEGAILHHDPALIAARLPTPSSVCPYLGLAAYDVDDADWYFGRESDVAECLERLDRAGVLAVVGPSGSGKSSLLRAGVGAALTRRGQPIAVITPGDEPMSALAALGPLTDSTALIVDQCEEAVSMCADADERTRFVAALAARAESSPLLLGLRADRLTDMTADRRFAQLVELGLYLPRQMSTESIRAAIESPARQAGLLLEAGLVDLLVRDVEGEPGSLPLLSHALYETWERREGSTLTVAGYQATGGIRGAVARSAELLYEQQPARGRQQLRDLMLRLVVPSPDGEPARARVPRRVAAPDAEREVLIDALVDARLLTSDSESIELAHEALARVWPRLRDWLDDDIEGQRIWRHLATAAQAWDEMERPASELYRGVRLARAVDWCERAAPDLGPTERSFLDASVDLDHSERDNAVRELRRRTRANRRLRVLAAAVTVLALAATVGVVVARREAANADAAADAARTHELVASATGLIDNDPSSAKLLAVASAEDGTPSLASEAALHEAWARDLSVSRWAFAGEVGVLSGQLNPTGDRLVAGGMFQEDGTGWTIEVVDPYTDEQLWSADQTESGETTSAFVAEPFFADGGKVVVAGGYWDPYSWRRIPTRLDEDEEPIPALLGAHIWDADTGELVDRIDLGWCGGVVVGLSATHLLAKTLFGPPDVVQGCRWRDGTVGVALVDRQTGDRTPLSSDVGPRWQWGAAMSEDGSVVAYDDATRGEIVVADVATGAEIVRTAGSGVRDITADGSLILVGIAPIEVIDASTGQIVTAIDVRQRPNLNARFDPGGRYVYTAGEDGALRRWTATGGGEVFSYPAVGGGPVRSNDSGLVVVSNPDQQVLTIIDPERRGEIAALRPCAGRPEPDSLRVVDDVLTVAEWCGDDSSATTFALDPATGDALSIAPRRAGLAPALSADGTRIADQDMTSTPGGEPAPGAIRVRDARTGDVVLSLEPVLTDAGAQFASRLRWSPDGRFIAGVVDHDVAVWNATTGALVHRAHDAAQSGGIADVLFTPDSQRLISTPDRRIVERSTDTWDVVVDREETFDGAYQVGLVGFDPSGTRLVVVGGFQSNAASPIVWLDVDDLHPVGTVRHAHVGSITSAAASPDGRLVATAADDGSVRVWDMATGHLEHDVAGTTSSALGIAFVDQNHLAVASNDGFVLVLTIDPSELLDDVRASLTKGLTQPECERFNFGDDCPTLSELGASPATPSDLDGSYRVTLDRGDLVTIVGEEVSDHFGQPLIPGSMDDFAAAFAGDYSITFDHGRFDIVRSDIDEPACTGSLVIRGRHVWLRSERGALCEPVKFLDADFDVSGDRLTFDRDGLRAEFPWLVTLASAPLQRAT